MIVLVVLLILLSFFLAKIAGRTLGEAKTISIETGIQNGTLGIVVASLISGTNNTLSLYAFPSAMYGLMMFVVIVPMLLIYRRIG